MAAADTLAPPDHAGIAGRGALREPSQRGSLELADRAVSALVRAAVLDVDGVASPDDSSGRVAGALGRDLPRVGVTRAGTQVDVEVHIATEWPRPAADVADAVRSAVSSQLARLAGLQTGTVSVAVVKVVRAARPESVRRVQ